MQSWCTSSFCCLVRGGGPVPTVPTDHDDARHTGVCQGSVLYLVIRKNKEPQHRHNKQDRRL
nr:MAG TPA: hypothetical protein [Caudoviricetes sp.]